MRMYDLPDARGHFGPYGGVFVAETLTRGARGAARRLRARAQGSRVRGRVPLRAQALRRAPQPDLSSPSACREKCGGARIYIKREDLNHTGAHKINNTIGQALLARSMKKPRVIAETGAGMHGVATATVAARYGMECVVYMGTRGREAPVRERVPHEAPRRESGAGGVRLEDPEGRAQRGDARLGHQRRQHLLHHRHRRRSAPVSDDGARFPVGDRRGEPGADAGARRAPARRGARLRRRRLECHGHLLSRTSRTQGEADRRRSGRRRASPPASTRRRCARESPACCTATAPICCRTPTARSPRRTRFPPASTIPASAPSTPG